MGQEQIINRLREYYASRGIGAVAFSCTNRAACSKGALDFTEAKEPHIGLRYGEGIPRLVVLSLDPGSSPSAPENRTIERRDNWKPGWRARGLEKTRHWYRTLEAVHRIFTGIQDSLACVPVEDILPYFAHANSARCCQSKPNRRMADETLFSRCREFVRGEVEILSPEILVTQGDYARMVIDGKFSIRQKNTMESINGGKHPWWLVDMGDHEMLWFHTHHPNQRGGLFSRERRDFILPPNQYARIAREFWERQTRR